MLGTRLLETRLVLESQLLFEFCGFLHFYSRHVNGVKLADTCILFLLPCVSVCVSVHTCMGVTSFQKAGGTIFGGRPRSKEALKTPRKIGCGEGVSPVGREKAPSCRRRGVGTGEGEFFIICSRKAHSGGYLMRFDVVILKLCFAVHRMLQGCVTDSISYSPTGCSSRGRA